MAKNDSLWTKLRRNRYSIVFATGAGSVLIAYVSYKWLSDKKEARAQSEASVLASAWQQSQTYQQQAEEKLVSHFESVKKVALQVTLPLELLKLKQQIFELADVDKLTKKLRDARSGIVVISHEEKQELWNQLKVVSFERFISLVWLMPFLQLLVLTQLGVLGRYLYLSSSMQESWYGETWVSWAWGKVSGLMNTATKSKDPYSCSQEFQHKYMELFKQLVPALTNEFMKGVSDVCQTHISPQGLYDKFDFRFFESVVADLHEVCAQRWDLLLSEWLPSFQKPQDNTTLSDKEQKLLQNMWHEVLQIVRSHRFAIVLREMVTYMADAANEEVSKSWPVQTTAVKEDEEASVPPLAKVVPLLPTVSKNLVSASSQTYKVLAEMDNVKEFCAAVYSGQQFQ